MSLRLASAALFACFALTACSGSAPSSGEGDPTSPASGSSAPLPGTGNTTPPDSPASTAPTECASPSSPPLTSLVRAPGSPTAAIALPIAVKGTTSSGIDVQYFTVTLDDVTRLHLKAEIKDFADTTEKTGVGVEIRRTDSPGEINTSQVRAHVDPSTPSNAASSDWLFPGKYQVIFSRSTGGSANAASPTLSHDYSFSIDVERPPVVTNGCTLPASAKSATDVKATPECNAWCKKLPACGVACRDECTIPVGECAASVLKQLECNTKAKLECVTQGGGVGISVDAICNLDASVCAPGTIRK